MIQNQTNQQKVKKNPLLIALVGLSVILVGALAVTSYIAGCKHQKKIAVDFSITETVDDSEHKYQFLDKQISDYICELSSELDIDSDLVVAILMCENPEFNPEATHRNENGTIDVGMFQLNDYYLWTTFKRDYWFDNIELDPFNWKHNSYIAIHHIKELQNQLKVQDDVIMAYNGGKGAVMNGTVKPSTRVYLAKVKNNLFLLKGGNND